MSYQVLARKWRPRIFSEMVGQEHVLRALINALDNERLHHAYLFTGTRGVGKTTIARILAKCLNCEQGISSTPCGECSACTSIAEGRFVDLIEVDAASRTKVEDTRELMENVQYAPTVGRFKVYLIDEVHMLSTHSFNALLKTLEEPPPHVKFLLATTDPQKLPVTILSRCLQFNLKNLSPERIVEHLKHVLTEEQVPCEEAGLWALARAADGSMRDALSLTDQAIAHGGGQLTEAEVSTMLGTIDLTAIADIARALVNNDGTEVLAVVQQMAEHAPDYNAALADLLSVWHRVAIAQTVPDALDNRHGDYQLIQELSKALSKEDVQLFYQTVLLGRRDLPLAPDPKTGFEMVMLRMLAFQPVRESRIDPPSLPAVDSATVDSSRPVEGESDPVKKPEPAAPEVAAVAEDNDSASAEKPSVTESMGESNSLASGSLSSDNSSLNSSLSDNLSSDRPALDGLTPHLKDGSGEYQPDEYEAFAALSEGSEASNIAIEIETLDKTGDTSSENIPEKVPENTDVPLTGKDIQALTEEVHQQDVGLGSNQESSSQKDTLQKEIRQKDTSQSEVVPSYSLSDLKPERWLDIYQGLSVGGVLQNVAANLAFVEARGNTLRFDLDIENSSLYEEGHQQRLAEVLTEYFGQPISVDIEVGVVAMETPQANRLRKREERQAAALDSLKHDPNVRRIMDVFGGVLLEKTVKPID